MNIRFLLRVALFGLIITSAAVAQMPRTISYQGILSDGSGNFISDGNHSLTLSIYDNIASSSPIYTETQTVPVVKGLFNAIIGSNVAIPLTITFDRAYFLGVRVDGGAELNPRTPLSAVPYAMRAAVADKAMQIDPQATGVVTSVNTQSGPLVIVGGGGTSVNTASGIITISSTGGGGNGIQGIQNVDGSITVSNPNGPVATVGVATNGITVEKIAANSISSDKIVAGAVQSDNLANAAVTTAKISTAGAVNGQVLGFNGSSAAWMDQSLTLPLVRSQSSTLTPLLSLTQTGTQHSASFIVSNASNTNAGVRAETNGGGYGIQAVSTGTGNAAAFQISNSAATQSVINATGNGIGSGLTVALTNASNGARGIDVNQAGVGPGVFATSAGGNAVWGITSSISAAGLIGDNTFGEAVVGRNRGGNGVGAVVGRNDSSGYGVRGFNTKNGIGVLGQAGISGGTGVGGRFENVNAANTSNALEASTNGTGSAILANNSNASTGNIAVFQSQGANKARIDKTGKGFFNGGTQASGADVAESFAVEGERSHYEAGDVLVISSQSNRTLTKSDQAYSTKVAGVIATKPGVLLSPLDIDANLDAQVPLGVVGVIPTKVCNQGGTIHRGDLLVCSSISGYAMKADPQQLTIDSVVGKALEDFDGEKGLIEVFVNVR